FRSELDHRVKALGDVVDLIGEAALAPQVGAVDLSSATGEKGLDFLDLGLDVAFGQLGPMDRHHFITAHWVSPPVDIRSEGPTRPETCGAGVSRCRQREMPDRTPYLSWRERTPQRGQPSCRQVGLRRAESATQPPPPPQRPAGTPRRGRWRQ